MQAGNGVERAPASWWMHPKDESHRMPRRQGRLPSMSENAIAYMKGKQQSLKLDLINLQQQ